jgi:hypothetical protein
MKIFGLIVICFLISCCASSKINKDDSTNKNRSPKAYNDALEAPLLFIDQGQRLIPDRQK